jgi:hypothetical protein
MYSICTLALPFLVIVYLYICLCTILLSWIFLEYVVLLYLVIPVTRNHASGYLYQMYYIILLLATQPITVKLFMTKQAFMEV